MFRAVEDGRVVGLWAAPQVGSGLLAHHSAVLHFLTFGISHSLASVSPMHEKTSFQNSCGDSRILCLVLESILGVLELVLCLI
jgi:hypothetical protein